jgi:hypothetical protein
MITTLAGSLPVLVLGITKPVLAYIDPGTGNILMQGILVTALGALTALKIFGKKILDATRKLFSKH